MYRVDYGLSRTHQATKPHGNQATMNTAAVDAVDPITTQLRTQGFDPDTDPYVESAGVYRVSSGHLDVAHQLHVTGFDHGQPSFELDHLADTDKNECRACRLWDDLGGIDALTHQGTLTGPGPWMIVHIDDPADSINIYGSLAVLRP